MPDDPSGGREHANSTSPLRWVIHIALVLVVLGLVIAAFIVWESRGGRPRTVHAAGPTEAIPVSAFAAAPQDVPLAPTYLGRTDASQQVEIRARVNGFIEAFTFEEGGRVEQGQTLFRIDAQPFRVRLNEAQAAVASSQARLEQARRQLERARTAAQGGAVSETELDQWLTEEQVALADLELQRARAATAALDLSYTEIVSPITGQIGETEQDVGSYVQAGAESLLATVQQVDPIYVHFSVSEQNLREWQERIAAGEIVAPAQDQIPISIQLVDGSIYPHRGHLNFVGVELAPTTGTVMVRGELPNPDGVLRPGQFVRVTAHDITRLGAILVPQRAVSQSPAGASVYIVDDSSNAQMRPVTLGEWVGDNWIITSGLRPGDRVIVDQLMRLRPGTPVAPTAVPAPVLEPGAAASPAPAPAGPAQPPPAAPPASEEPN